MVALQAYDRVCQRQALLREHLDGLLVPIVDLSLCHVGWRRVFVWRGRHLGAGRCWRTPYEAAHPKIGLGTPPSIARVGWPFPLSSCIDVYLSKIQPLLSPFHPSLSCLRIGRVQVIAIARNLQRSSETFARGMRQLCHYAANTSHLLELNGSHLIKKTRAEDIQLETRARRPAPLSQLANTHTLLTPPDDVALREPNDRSTPHLRCGV